MKTFKEFLNEGKDSFGNQAYTYDQVIQKINDGIWSAEQDVVKGKHITIRISGTRKSKTIMVTEASDYKVYMIDKEFWLAYGDGSGTTAQVPNMDSFLTNKSGDKNYDSIVDSITKKFVTYNEPQMTKKSSDKMTKYSLYYLPAYKHSDVRQGKIEAWGGEIKPFDTYYMLVIQGESVDIIQFFKTKNEAKAYINSLA